MRLGSKTRVAQAGHPTRRAAGALRAGRNRHGAEPANAPCAPAPRERAAARAVHRLVAADTQRTTCAADTPNTAVRFACRSWGPGPSILAYKPASSRAGPAAT